MNKQELFKQDVKPHLMKVFDACLEHGIPFIGLSAINYGEDATSFTVSSTNVAVREGPEAFTVIMMMLHEEDFREKVLQLAALWLEVREHSRHVQNAEEQATSVITAAAARKH